MILKLMPAAVALEIDPCPREKLLLIQALD
jgi:hypothetical protein